MEEGGGADGHEGKVSSSAEPGANQIIQADDGKPQEMLDAVRVGLDHVPVAGASPDGLATLRTARAGVLVAVLAALSVNLGKVCQKRGTQDLPVLLFKFSVCWTCYHMYLHACHMFLCACV